VTREELYEVWLAGGGAVAELLGFGYDAEALFERVREEANRTPPGLAARGLGCTLGEAARFSWLWSV
jgi:hypothetical protein